MSSERFRIFFGALDGIARLGRAFLVRSERTRKRTSWLCQRVQTN